MRKILDTKDSTKKQKKNTIILGVVLIIIMAFSTLGYAFFSSDKSDEQTDEKISYKEIEFQKTEFGLWEFEINGYEFATRYNPLETENITNNILKNIQNYQGKVLYFGVDSAEAISQIGNQEISSNLNDFILRANMACLTDNCSEDYPIKNCSEENIIIFEDKQGNPELSEKENCIYVRSSNQEILRSSDAFLFKILGLQ